jgi:uncharacterized protein YwqG
MASIQWQRERIRERMERAQLDRIAPAILELVRSSIRLNLGEPSSEAVTRLGGTPNLPEDIPWPLRRNGDPHSFIAQVDLARLEPIEGLPLPASGSLFFFCDSVDIPAGFNPSDRDGFKVIYSASPLSENALCPTPRRLSEEQVFKGFTLNPKFELVSPPWRGNAIARLQLSESNLDKYASLFNIDQTTHRIGGYPEIIQGDDLELTSELVLHGIPCGDAAGYQYGRIHGLGAGATDWRLLMQIDSQEEAGMMWHDVGRLFFMMREQDLENLRFDQAWMGMQSS